MAPARVVRGPKEPDCIAPMGMDLFHLDVTGVYFYSSRVDLAAALPKQEAAGGGKNEEEEDWKKTTKKKKGRQVKFNVAIPTASRPLAHARQKEAEAEAEAEAAPARIVQGPHDVLCWAANIRRRFQTFQPVRAHRDNQQPPLSLPA
ncbi:uncharacterized protein UV8b_06207 [Ustilaginoidea virens]|uniref:Uncharacterized protein n=1 Tax=Ustilaginoidea virens TaxID=1159556 RepID=A0A063C1Y7_USTVR|nr:uncharacterized protein UV8b_06207 [Ustilaginoidea virens]QUC21966.1 hypothetical protein UV8b_06207 [Ustilaginoidea virens]GAO20137.1 hypothetical protein UVI_02023520 [Ustilaginoidea virens]